MSSRRDGRVRKQRGVSIVEALVALIVLSVGMLGIAVMYLESVKANRTALSRTLAVHLVNDMADRIRANRGARDKYKLALTDKPTSTKDCSATDQNCTPTEMAQYDLSQWYASVTKDLPKGGDGLTPPQTTIAFEAGATSNDPDTYTIQTRWKDAGSDDFLTTQLEFTQIGAT